MENCSPWAAAEFKGCHPENCYCYHSAKGKHSELTGANPEARQKAEEDPSSLQPGRWPEQMPRHGECGVPTGSAHPQLSETQAWPEAAGRGPGQQEPTRDPSRGRRGTVRRLLCGASLPHLRPPRRPPGPRGPCRAGQTPGPAGVLVRPGVPAAAESTAKQTQSGREEAAPPQVRSPPAGSRVGPGIHLWPPLQWRRPHPASP